MKILTNNFQLTQQNNNTNQYYTLYTWKVLKASEKLVSVHVNIIITMEDHGNGGVHVGGDDGDVDDPLDRGHGEVGDHCEMGDREEAGDRGDVGDRGEAGDHGDVGDRGEAGDRGEVGDHGDVGDHG